MMLSDKDAVATVAVKNLERAKKILRADARVDADHGRGRGDPDGNIFSLVTPPSQTTRETVGASARSSA
jgi:hypothetical protein